MPGREVIVMDPMWDAATSTWTQDSHGVVVSVDFLEGDVTSYRVLNEDGVVQEFRRWEWPSTRGTRRRW